ncbi:SDR family oxidoreductase [Schumannella luteola]
MTSPFDLTGSLAVVTGASRGIGAGIALGLAQAGADVVGIARGSQDATAAAVHEVGREYTALAADLSTPRGVQELVASLDALDRPVDILVNNAGIAERTPAERHTDEQWATVLDVNLTAPFVLARELGARMLDRGSGRIVFLASMMTWQGGRDVVSYTASKSAIAGVVHALANEWAGRGVGVNAVAPGYIETELTSGTHGDPERRAAFQARIPAGRWGSPEDIAGAVVYLASPAAAYVHGVVLPVDGGWLVR